MFVQMDSKEKFERGDYYELESVPFGWEAEAFTSSSFQHASEGNLMLSGKVPQLCTVPLLTGRRLCDSI